MPHLSVELTSTGRNRQGIVFDNKNLLFDDELNQPDNGQLIYGNSRNISWEYKNVSLTRVQGYGFGIAVSGGSDNPHFANGDPAIAISDVLKGGPAETKLQVNDRIITANGIKLENVDYGTAVQVLRDSGPTVNLIIKRRIINQNQKVTLNKVTNTKLKNIQPVDFGVNLQIRVYVKDSKNVNLTEGDEVISINSVDVGKLIDFKRAFNINADNKLTLTVVKQNQQAQQMGATPAVHQTQPSYESSNGNLYVQPPTRKEPPPPIRPPLPREELTPPPPPPPNHPHHQPSPTKYYNNNTQQRYINFIKKNQLGIRLSGGNNVGIYISAVQPDTPADQGGLKRGDRILRVNEIEYNNQITREEAIEKLSLLKNETIVSLIVRFVPDFEKILTETEFHDKIYLKTKFDLFYNSKIILKKNTRFVVCDTLSTANPNLAWEAFLIDNKNMDDNCKKIQIPNFKQAANMVRNYSSVVNSIRGSFRNGHKFTSNREEVYERIVRKKVSWPRPVVIYSTFTDLIYERLCKEFPHRFTIIKSTLIEEINTELRPIMEKGQHGLLQIKSVASYEKLSNTVCPIPFVVKTEEKQILKDILKVNNNKSSSNSHYYSTLLRSFNKSQNHHTSGSVYKKQTEELLKTEEDLGEVAIVVGVANAENWFRNVIEAIETELKYDFVWVNNQLDYPDNEEQEQYASQKKQEVVVNKVDLPNYNLPPPYAVVPTHQQSNGNSSINDHHFPIVNNQHPHHLIHSQLSEPSSFYQQTRRMINSSRAASSESTRPYSTESLNTTTAQSNSLKKNKSYNNNDSTPLLAHSPVNEVNAPQIDRTKKPTPVKNTFYPNPTNPNPTTIVGPNRQKPVPPPKPTKIMSKIEKVFNNGEEVDDFKQSYYLNLPINSKSFVGNKSAFELYRKPTVPPTQTNFRSQSTLSNDGTSNNYMTINYTHQQPPLPLQQENTTTGTFDSKGGILLQRNVPANQIPIELRIPEGAIPEGSVQTIWFHAVPTLLDNQLDLLNGNYSSSILPKETNSYLISPLIKFGPEGLRFSKPVEIRIPQYSKNSNASVLLGNDKNWSKINIQQDNDNDNNVTPFKIVSLTIQQF